MLGNDKDGEGIKKESLPTFSRDSIHNSSFYSLGKKKRITDSIIAPELSKSSTTTNYTATISSITVTSQSLRQNDEHREA